MRLPPRQLPPGVQHPKPAPLDPAGQSGAAQQTALTPQQQQPRTNTAAPEKTVFTVTDQSVPVSGALLAEEAPGRKAGRQLAHSPVALGPSRVKERRVEDLRVQVGVPPTELVARQKHLGLTFRPTLVGRMDMAPEKAALVSDFMAAMCNANKGHTSIIGSSTIEKGSPDLIMNLTASRLGVPMVRVNPEAYFFANGNPEALADGVKPGRMEDRNAAENFKKAVHYCYPTPEAYGDALAVVSNTAILAGGRADGLRELKGKIDAGHPVILVEVPAYPDSGKVWDGARVNAAGNPAPRTDNAVGYILHQLDKLSRGELDAMLPDFGGITRQWLVDHKADLERLMVRVELTPGVPLDDAVAKAQAHFKATLGAAG